MPNKRMMARTIPGETKRARLKKGQKMQSLKGPKRGRGLVSLVIRSYLIDGASNVTSM
jgi:hypothetical protein